jgi:hypothetical protein
MAMHRERITLPIYNLGCGGGGALAVERALTQVSGVAQAYVNPLTEMAYVVYDPTVANAEHLRGVIDAHRRVAALAPFYDHQPGWWCLPFWRSPASIC